MKGKTRQCAQDKCKAQVPVDSPNWYCYPCTKALAHGVLT